MCTGAGLVSSLLNNDTDKDVKKDSTDPTDTVLDSSCMGAILGDDSLSELYALIGGQSLMQV